MRVLQNPGILYLLPVLQAWLVWPFMVLFWSTTGLHIRTTASGWVTETSQKVELGGGGGIVRAYKSPHDAAAQTFISHWGPV